MDRCWKCTRPPSCSASAASRATIVDSLVARDAAEPERRAHRALAHDAAARERQVLLVQREHAAAHALIAQRPAQHARAHHRAPVVGEAERPLRAQLRHVRELLAAQPARDRGQEADGHARLVRRGLAQRAKQRRRVDRGVGVGHRYHGAEPARRGGARAGLEILLVLLAGRAQMHVRIEEGREEVHARATLSDLLAVARERARRRRSPRSHPCARGRRSGRRCRARGSIACTSRKRTSAFGWALETSGALPMLRRAAAAAAVPARARRRAARRGPPCARRRRPRPVP